MPEAQSPVEVFYSYARADKRWLKRLDTHLSLLKRQGLISTWYDRQIVPGTDRAQDIDAHLSRASVILLLISPDFLASDYCYGIEMQRAVERHQAKEARVIPILLRPVDWKDAPFAHLQVLPTDAKAVTTWGNRDTAFVDVASGIRRAIEDLSVLEASAPRAVLPPIWNIPYPRNSFFVGREDIFSRLRTQMHTGQASASCNPQAISGLEGIGKTQIAVEYAYRFHQDYQVVLWAYAENTEALISSYTTIATLLNLPEKDAQKQTIMIQAVKRWLQTHSQWLLILDTADDLALVREFLPPSGSGHVLLTTRAQAMGDIASRLEVEVLPPELGVLFLLHRASLLAVDASLEQSAQQKREIAHAICEELGGLPLALDQAGAYIEETGCSLGEYQSLFQHRRADLLERRGLVGNHPQSVAATWSLSFARVEQKSPVAADLLRLCAFLAPDAIPEEIVTEGAPYLGPHLDSVGRDSYLLNQGIEVLRAYSLVGRDPSSRTLSVHRLVQAVLRDAMTVEMEKLWMKRTVQAVNAAFPPVEFVHRRACERCTPHALLCAQWIEQEPMTISEARLLLNRTGLYLGERAQYIEAEPLLQRSLSISEQQLGPEHPETAVGLSNLATLSIAQGKYVEAEQLCVRALAIIEQTFGQEHSSTATYLGNLASLYRAQGRHTQAKVLCEQALSIRERHLGSDHPDTAISLNNLAHLFMGRGRHTRAEPLLQRTLLIREQRLGPDHPSTAMTRNALGALYERLGEYKQAARFYEQALSICKQHFGFDHPDTTTCLNNLALLYMRLGQYTQAEPLCVQVLSLSEQQSGLEHLDTATCLNNLASLYQEQGKYTRAEPLFQRALSIREQQLGQEHPDTATCLNNLASLYQEQGKYTQAELLFQRALSICEQCLGPDHPDTARALNNLGRLFTRLEKYEQAEPLLQRALSIAERRLGANHPSTGIYLNNLASLYRDQGKYTQAERLYQRALPIFEQRLGQEHPQTQLVRKGYSMLLQAIEKDASRSDQHIKKRSG